MLNDITLGQFFPVDSPIHKLDPRVKIMSSLAYIIAVFFAKGFTGYLFVAVFTYSVILMSKVPLKLYLKGLKPLIFIIIFTSAINLFMTDGKIAQIGSVPLKFGIFKITVEGIDTAVKMTLRLIFLVAGTSVLTFTTSPIVLTDGIESLLSPFKKIGVPAHELAMMMSIAIRFIPTLLEETDKIMKAQASRGADFENGSVIKRIKALVPILVPLFISSFRRADELALAMECRCYRGGKGRTRLKTLKIAPIDYIACAFMLVFIVGIGAIALFVRV